MNKKFLLLFLILSLAPLVSSICIDDGFYVSGDFGNPVYDTCTSSSGDTWSCVAGSSCSFKDYYCSSGQITSTNTFCPYGCYWGCCSSTSPYNSCNNHQQDGDETGVDCGGSCPKACSCLEHPEYNPSFITWGDLASSYYYNYNDHCYDSASCALYPSSFYCGYQDECTGSDCFLRHYSCPSSSSYTSSQVTCEYGCKYGKCCNSASECEPNCGDGLQNGDETGVDCGGSCNACPDNTCSNRVKDPDEEGIDCGGTCTAKCGDYYMYGAWTPSQFPLLPSSCVTPYALSGFIDDTNALGRGKNKEYLFFACNSIAYIYEVTTAKNPQQHPNNPDAAGEVTPRIFTQVSSWNFQAAPAEWITGAVMTSKGIYYGIVTDNPCGIYLYDLTNHNKQPTCAYSNTLYSSAYPNIQTFAFDSENNNFWFGTAERDLYSIKNKGQHVSPIKVTSYPVLNSQLPFNQHDGLVIYNKNVFYADTTSDAIGFLKLNASGGISSGTTPIVHHYYDPNSLDVEGMSFGPNNHFWLISRAVQPSIYEVGGGNLQTTVQNQPPIANAGPNQTVQLNLANQARANLSGFRSSDSDLGDTLTYKWNLDSSPAESTATITPTTLDTQNLSVIFNKIGVYNFSLIVTDNHLAPSDPSPVSVTVGPRGNQPPIANAGPNQTVYLNGTGITFANLSGSASSDSDGRIAEYSWSPLFPSSSVIFTPSTADQNLTIRFNATGIYTLRLTVTDNLGEASTSLVSVIVFSNAQSPTGSGSSLSPIVALPFFTPIQFCVVSIIVFLVYLMIKTHRVHRK